MNRGARHTLVSLELRLREIRDRNGYGDPMDDALRIAHCLAIAEDCALLLLYPSGTSDGFPPGWSQEEYAAHVDAFLIAIVGINDAGEGVP